MTNQTNAISGTITRIAGCWVHCRRKFDEALKAVPKAAKKESLSYLIIKQIQAIYREEDKLKELKPEDRLKQRQVVIKPLVDALFAYLKSNERKASTYGRYRPLISGKSSSMVTKASRINQKTKRPLNCGLSKVKVH